MNSKETERLLALAQSVAYQVFGFGSDRLEFGRQLRKLGRDRPAEFDLLFDLAARMSFVDRLRHEIGWYVETDDPDDRSFEANLDALEVYLLCTCIDALANAQVPQQFDSWVEQNQAAVDSTLAGREVTSADQYLEITSELHYSYQLAGQGLTRNFIGVFEALPGFLKEYLAESYRLIEGAPWDKHAGERIKGWNKKKQLSKVKFLASKYLWSLRRCGYTHQCRVEEAVAPAHWRRLAIVQDRPGLFGTGQGWRLTLFYEHIAAEERGDIYQVTSRPRKVRYSLASRNRADESHLLRAIVVITVLRRMLHYLPDRTFLQELLHYYEALDVLYGLLQEMRVNINYLDQVVSGTIIDDSSLQSFPLPVMATAVADSVLSDFSRYLRGLERDIRSYSHYARQFNEKIVEFNELNPPNAATWGNRRRAVALFCRELLGMPINMTFRRSHRWAYDNLRRWLRTGETHDVSDVALLGWSAVWRSLRESFETQPHSKEYPEYPYVRTLGRRTRNDIVDISEEGVTVRSSSTGRNRQLPANLFEAWWNHLVQNGSASLTPGDSNTPRTRDSRIVGAIWATCLPDLIKIADGKTIELIEQ